MILRQQAALDYPTFPGILQLFRVHLEKLCRDCSRSQPDTRNLCSMPGNVFVDPDDPDASSLTNVYARSPTATYGEPVFFLSAGRLRGSLKQMKDTQSFTIRAPRFAGNVPTWDPPSFLQKGLIHKITWLNNRGIRSRRCISIDSLRIRHFSVRRRASKQKYVPVLITVRKHCVRFKQVEVADSVDDLFDVAINSRTSIPKFQNARCGDRFHSEEDHPKKCTS